MKKIALIAVLSILTLAGCSNNSQENERERASSSAPQASSSSQTSSDSAELDRLRKELEDALTNPNAVFPQLSDQVAEDEAAVKLVTTEGDITIKLFPKQAPLASENFLTHAKEGYYDGLTFHRVIKDFMIQGGDPKGDGSGGQSIWKDKDANKDEGFGFKNEYSPYLYNLRGALSMANAGPGTNGSQFFINQNKSDLSSKLSPESFPAKIIEAYKQGGNPNLDGGNYTVFGQVIEGMDVVDKIAETETDDNDKPKTDIKIEKIEIIKDYDFKK